MAEELSILKRCALFEGISREEMDKVLACLSARKKSFRKEEIIFHIGQPAKEVGIVLSGMVQVVQEDFNGNRNILTHLQEGELFGEVFACVGTEHIPVTVQAMADVTVLFLDFRRIITTCPSSCSFHTKLIENMLRLIARKNLSLSEKVTCLGHRTTQEKVEAFLALWHQRSGANPFTIPFSRAEMADYLCVDRSALSAVLSKMQSEGIIRYHKNEFELLG